MEFLKRIILKPKLTKVLTPTEKLNKTLQMLEKREKVLIRKASQAFEKAKQSTRAKNKREAMYCLKRKKLYERRIENDRLLQLRIHHQLIMLEGAKATTETVDALRTGAAAATAMLKAKNINDVNNIMDKINEENETIKRMQEAVSAPSGAVAVFDEDELAVELEELKVAELEEGFLLPAATASTAPVHVLAGLLPAPPVPQGTDEEDELADEMAF